MSPLRARGISAPGGLKLLVLRTPAVLEEPFWEACVSFSSYLHQDALPKAARVDHPTP
jgi:hypothetical protein